MNLNPDLHRFLYRVAQAYYIDGLTQQEVAARFNLSRPKVSRLLQEARDCGVVNITLVPPTGGHADLESQLEQRYGLEEAIVVSVSDPQNLGAVARELGPAAAECLVRSIRESSTIGMTWGTTLRAVVEALPSGAWPGAAVVQMNGGLGPLGYMEHSTDLVRRTAQKLNAPFHLIAAPGIASSADAARALRSDPEIARTLALAAKADVAVVGIGVLSAEAVLFQSDSIVRRKDYQELRKAGAVGDVVLHFINDEGAPIDLEINQRIIGLSFEQIRRIPRIIGVAGGEKKYRVIRAVLRSRLLKVLVTDHATARRLSAEE